MDELMEFDRSVEEAVGWLEQAQNNLEGYLSPGNEGGDTQADEALRRFDAVFKAIKAVREPLAERVAEWQKHQQEQDIRYSA
jgi:hypothetical protein